MHDKAPPIKGDAKPFVVVDGKLITIKHEMPITVHNTENTRGT
jgi:hypothetical protein